MNSFDPFVSAQYRQSIKQQNLIQQEQLIPQKSESQYIYQLLSSCFSGASKQITQQTEIELGQQKSIQEMKSQTESIILSQSSGSSKKPSKNSPFHNFQKHLVITLRRILNLKILSEKSGPSHDLAAKIFGQFKITTKTSRSFLQQIFGLYQIKDQTSKQKFMKNLRRGQLSRFLETHTDQTIEQAYQILRQYSKIQLEQIQIQSCLARRKIEKKHEFIQYIGFFKRQLVQGKQRKKAYKLLANNFQKRAKTMQLNKRNKDRFQLGG